MTAPAQTALVRNGDPAAIDHRLPAPVDKAALKSYLAILEDPEALQLQNRLAAAYDAACASLIGPNDVQLEGGRSFKKKSAWKKLARYFSIATAVLERSERFMIDETTGESVFVATCTVRATAPWGQYADSIGACATDEETGRRKITIADAIGTAETRASNRATSNLIAMGEVSAEEASREDREQLVRKAADEMTVEEAKLVKFPWRKPEKYADKPLGDLSDRMLQTVLDAVNGEIEKSGETPRRLELKVAAGLLIDAREFERSQKAADATPASTEQPSEPAVATEPVPSPAGSGEPAAPVDTKLAPGKIEDALAKPADGVVTLSRRISELLENKKFTEGERRDFRAKLGKADSVESMQLLIAEIEKAIELPF